jgi:hypothetical protein
MDSVFTPTRRSFLAASLAGLAPTRLFALDKLADAHKSPEVASPTDTLFLTWQRDPTTTMTVQWVGPLGDPADARVSYATAAGGLSHVQPASVRPFPLTHLMLYRAELAGLVPGTDYEFRVGRLSAAHRFRTMPAHATDAISFISGGDCGVNPHTVANNIQAARQDPAFAVIGGDLAYDNGVSAETFLAFLRNYSKHMVGRDGRLIPMLACLGNHEVDGGYSLNRSKAPFFYALFDGLFPETGYAALDFGGYLSLILLDTGHTSPIDGAQADWLEKTLAVRAAHPNVFVVNHVPAYPSFRDMHGTGDGNRKYWVPLFEKYRVPVVLEHHDHTFKRTKPLIDGLAHHNGVLYLGDGSWGQIRTPHSPESLSHLAATSRDYHLSLHRIEGEDRYHLALDENGRVMDVCHSGLRKIGIVPTHG